MAGSTLRPGVVAAIQTFGDRLNLYPHLHFLVTEGGVDEAGVFHKIPRIDDSRLAELFGREVLADLVRKELLSPEWAERLLSWPHTGFNVHSLVRAKTKPEAERVGKYMIRPILALDRLFFLEPEGKVSYRHGENGAKQETMDYLEFIARVTSHIPDKGQVMVRYYGLYANAHRGKVKKAGLVPDKPPPPRIAYQELSMAAEDRGDVCRISCALGVPAACEFAFSYFEGNLTSDHAAIYHPRRWDKVILVLERSFSRHSRKGNSYP